MKYKILASLLSLTILIIGCTPTKSTTIQANTRPNQEEKSDKKTEEKVKDDKKSANESKSEIKDTKKEKHIPLVKVGLAVELMNNNAYTEYDEYYSPADPDFTIETLLYSDKELKNFKLYIVEESYIDEKTKNKIYKVNPVFSRNLLSPVKPLFATLTSGVIDDMDYALSYTDDDGAVHDYGIFIGGEPYYDLKEVMLDKPSVEVQYVDDILNYGDNYDILNMKKNEFSEKICFTTNEEVRDFTIYELEFTKFNEKTNLPMFNKDIVYSSSKRFTNRPLIVNIVFSGSIPSYGISYVDSDDKVHFYGITQSGLDGSVILTDIE